MRPEEFFPALNAVLNGTSALLLVAGYIAIRNRRIALHKTCMTTAVIVSAVFLASSDSKYMTGQTVNISGGIR